MSEIELKPCPWCGQIPKLTEYEGAQMPFCANDHCPMVGDDTDPSTNEEAAAIWNTRPIEDALRAELEAARAEDEKDYADMRKFQALYIAADQDARQLADALTQCVALLDKAEIETPISAKWAYAAHEAQKAGEK